jgi:hypothetical protein
MKKIIQQSKEISTVWSDKSGEGFEYGFSPVEVTISFGYGSKYDGEEITLNYTDEEITSLLEWVRNNLSPKSKEEMQNKIKATDSLLKNNGENNDEPNDKSSFTISPECNELYKYLSN